MAARVRTVLAAPLRQGDAVVGVLYADAPQAAETDALEGAVELFQGIADQASMALSRARLHSDLVSTNEELRRQRDRLDQLNQQLDARVREKTALAEAQAAELAARLDELERLQAGRDAMARGLVHDIRNLVGSVDANVSYVEGFIAEEEEALEASQDAHEGTRQILALAEDVLSVSRIEAGAMELLVQALMIEQTLSSSVRRHAGRARDLNVTLSIGSVEPGLVVTADSKLLARVLDNLVGNAIRYAGSKGAVTLSARRTDRAVEITVADTGPGVPPEARQKIFEEWFTSGDSSGRHHGVGLHFCRLAVESHGGSVRVEGSSGDNRFVVSLPSRWDDDELEKTVSARPTVVSD
jgi:signal transduction histidine kinase